MYYKYPRTFHLPFSEGVNSDDKIIPSVEVFEGKEVIVSEKLDGENTSIYKNHIHARSLDSGYHPSREWIRKFAGDIGHLIPDDWRVCGENVYAKHSIHYENLKSYFYGFSLWDKDKCFSWDDTLLYFQYFGIEPVPTLYRGVYDEKIIKCLYTSNKSTHMEGYVVRITDSFNYSEFPQCVAKFVRKNHVQTSEHWMHQEMIKNKLA